MKPEQFSRLLEGWNRGREPFSEYLTPWNYGEEIRDAEAIKLVEEISGEKYTGEWNSGTEGVVLRLSNAKVAKIWIGHKAKPRIWGKVAKAGGDVPGLAKVYHHGVFEYDFGTTSWPSSNPNGYPFITIVEELSDVGEYWSPKALDQETIDAANQHLGADAIGAQEQTGVNSRGKRVVFDIH